MKKVKTIKLRPPKSKNAAELKNALGFSAVTFDAYGLIEKELKKNYPAGVYTVKLSPGGKLTVSVTHDYPITPDVILLRMVRPMFH